MGRRALLCYYSSDIFYSDFCVSVCERGRRFYAGLVLWNNVLWMHLSPLSTLVYVMGRNEMKKLMFFLWRIRHFKAVFVYSSVKSCSALSHEWNLTVFVMSKKNSQNKKKKNMEGTWSEGHCACQLTVFPQLGYIKNVVMWLNDRHLAKKWGYLPQGSLSVSHDNWK